MPNSRQLEKFVQYISTVIKMAGAHNNLSADFSVLLYACCSLFQCDICTVCLLYIYEYTYLGGSNLYSTKSLANNVVSIVSNDHHGKDGDSSKNSASQSIHFASCINKIICQSVQSTLVIRKRRKIGNFLFLILKFKRVKKDKNSIFWISLSYYHFTHHNYFCC